MPKLRVLLVTHYFSTHGGGVEIVADRLARLLATRHDASVQWVASDTDPLPRGLPEGVRCRAVSAWNVADRSLGIPFPFWGPEAIRQLGRSMGQCDVVHLHDGLYPGSVLAFLVATWQRVPVLVTQHIGHIPYRSRGLSGVLSVLNRTVTRLVLSRSDQVVFISPAVKDYFGAFCRYRRAPRYIENGVDRSTFAPLPGNEREAIRTELGVARGKLVHLFVGRFVEKKGLAILRELAAAFPDDSWIFAGSGALDPEGWGLPNVKVVRGATGAELARYYHAADLLVLPSTGEGFPLVVQEAMACGTPVLVSEGTADGCPAARPVMFVEAVGGADTTERWAVRIAALRSAPERLEARRAEVAEFGREQSSWETTADEYAALLADLARQQIGRART